MSIFILNRYAKIYYSIVEKRKMYPISEDYFEKHHVVPKSLGGRDDSDNIIFVSAREHYLLHWLLVKMTDGKDKIKMQYALHCMSVYDPSGKRNMKSGWRYDTAKRHFSESMKNREFSDIHRKRLSVAQSNNRHSPETKKKISESLRGKTSPNKGKKFSDSHKEKISESLYGISKNGKKCMSPDGIIFNSLREAGEYYGVSSTAILGRIRRNTSSWKYV